MLMLNARLDVANYQFKKPLPKLIHPRQCYVVAERRFTNATMTRLHLNGYRPLDGHVLCMQDVRGHMFYVLAVYQTRDTAPEETALRTPPSEPTAGFYAWDRGLGLINHVNLVYPCMYAVNVLPWQSDSVFDVWHTMLVHRPRPQPLYGPLMVLLHNPQTLYLITERLMRSVGQIRLENDIWRAHPCCNDATTRYMRMLKMDNNAKMASGSAEKNPMYKRLKSHENGKGRTGKRLGEHLDHFTTADINGMKYCAQQDAKIALDESYPDRDGRFHQSEIDATWEDAVARYCTDVLVDVCAYIMHGVDPFAEMVNGDKNALAVAKNTAINSTERRREYSMKRLSQRSSNVGVPFNEVLCNDLQGTWAARDMTEGRRMHEAGSLRYDPSIEYYPAEIVLPDGFSDLRAKGQDKVCDAILEDLYREIGQTPPPAIDHRSIEFTHYIFNDTRYQDRLESDPWEDAQNAVNYRLNWERWWWHNTPAKETQIAYNIHRVLKTVCKFLSGSWGQIQQYEGVFKLPTPLEMEKAGYILMSVPKEEFRNYKRKT